MVVVVVVVVTAAAVLRGYQNIFGHGEDLCIEHNNLYFNRGYCASGAGFMVHYPRALALATVHRDLPKFNYL